jgi:hypothetical protein
MSPTTTKKIANTNKLTAKSSTFQKTSRNSTKITFIVIPPARVCDLFLDSKEV